MFTSSSQGFLSTIKVSTLIKNKKKVWQIFRWFFYSPDYAFLWIVKVFNLGAFYVLSYVFICLNFVRILNLLNNYTDRVIMKVLREQKQMWRNLVLFYFLLKINSKILGTMLINKSEVYVLLIFKGNNFFLSLFLFLDLTFQIILFSYHYSANALP